jgi:hypothetical protein
MGNRGANRRWLNHDPLHLIGANFVGQEGEDEDFHDTTCIAAMRLACLPGNARNAVATAAISANRQADKKT